LGDTQDFTDKVKIFLDQPKLLQHMWNNAYHTIRQGHWTKNTVLLETLYKQFSKFYEK
jgi:hypothetical protein